jgi:hypothetical protein
MIAASEPIQRPAQAKLLTIDARGRMRMCCDRSWSSCCSAGIW